MIVVEEKGKNIRNVLGPLFKFAAPVGLVAPLLLTGNVNAASVLTSGLVSLQIVPQLTGIGLILTQIATVLSICMFILAGIFYAIGQIMPPDKKAAFHSTSVNIVIGAIVLSALSFAATGLAGSASHLLTNATANSIT
jgi:hypothetical protein